VSVLIATHNEGKKEEFRALLRPIQASLVFPPELGLRIDVPEDQPTYRENAIQKASAHCQASGLITLADDSGLEVDALDGAPGIRSARYAPGEDADRATALLAALDGVPLGRRSARFRCALAVVTPWGATHLCEGVCEGYIALEPAGTGGFGYDPIFYLPEHGSTMAELAPEVKNRVSHRARAVDASLPWLRELLTGPDSVSGCP
jgi:XTP/dITP diphosphohydrolase